MAKVKYNKDGTREDGQVPLHECNRQQMAADRAAREARNQVEEVVHDAVASAFGSPLSKRRVQKPVRG